MVRTPRAGIRSVKRLQDAKSESSCGKEKNTRSDPGPSSNDSLHSFEELIDLFVLGKDRHQEIDVIKRLSFVEALEFTLHPWKEGLHDMVQELSFVGFRILFPFPEFGGGILNPNFLK